MGLVRVYAWWFCLEILYTGVIDQALDEGFGMVWLGYAEGAGSRG